MVETSETLIPNDARPDLINRQDVKQVTALLAVQAMTYFIPLVLIPYLGRTLGPEGFGRLAVAQSFGTYITVVVQYGFNYSGSRSVTQVLDDSAALASRVSDIMGAKALLTAVSLLACWLLFTLRLDFALGPRMFWSAIFWGIINGSTLVWYFQGSRQLDIFAYLDCAGRTVAIAVIFAMVHQSADAYLVLLLQGLGAGAALLLQFGIVFSRVEFCWPSWRASVQSLSNGFHVFASRCVESVYLTGTALILGTVRTPAEVGVFAGPEKIVRAVAYGIFPLYQVAYPRLVSELRHDKKHALRYAKATVLMATGAALALVAVSWIWAEKIIHTILGPQFTSSIGVLRMMLPLAVLMVAVGGIGSNLMLALNRDKWLTRILAMGGTFCIMVTVVLSRQFGAKGTCVSLLATYMLILGLIWLHFRNWPATESNGPVE
jgi:polysaccharide transporter, PST family